MFNLVADVESYPEFLPGCSAAHIYSRNGNQVTAGIALTQGPLKFEFTTCNQLVPHSRILMALQQGPFSALQGKWDFTPLGVGSKVALSLEFAFESRLTDLLLGPPFEVICNRVVDAFVQRAKTVDS